LFYESPEQLLEDPEVDVIVETIGGSGFARELITKALQNGKHVITANKDLIAVHGAELMEVARKNGRHLLFEAAVAGAIPVLRLLKDYLQVQDIQGIRGQFSMVRQTTYSVKWKAMIFLLSKLFHRHRI